jgi:adenylate kinase
MRSIGYLPTRKWLCLLLAACSLATAQAQSPVKPVLILLGPPGSGKSTQAVMVQKQYGFALITREQLMQDDPSLLARQKQPGIRGVEPRMDPALNGLFRKRLEKTDISKGLLLDGYPAAKDHGDFLVKVIQEKGLKNPVVLQLDVPDEVVRTRLKGQNPAQIEQDLKDYHRENDFLTVYFPQADVVRIDGTKKPDAVFDQIRKAIDEYMKRR